MKSEAKNKEPLFHIVKNDSLFFGKSLLIRVIGILTALIIVGLLSMILIKENPFLIYQAMIDGALIDENTLMQNTALLLMFGLAVIPAFKMKFWNLGANGQVLIGCLAAVACMKFIPEKNPEISNELLLLIMLAASILTSCLWSVIPAIFKAFFDTNETLFTLMMNYIAITLVNYFVFAWDKSNSGTLRTINRQTKLGWLYADVVEARYMLPLVVAIVMAVLLFVYMRYTKHGFEIALVGESVNTAKYVGINVKKVIIRTLILGGVLCGVIGFIYASCLEHKINPTVGGLGFTAILVAWLASFDPLLMIVTSSLVVFVDTGSKYISTEFNLTSNDYASIVFGIIFFFVIGSEFFIRYKIMINKKKLKFFAKEMKTS